MGSRNVIGPNEPEELLRHVTLAWQTRESKKSKNTNYDDDEIVVGSLLGGLLEFGHGVCTSNPSG